MNKDTWSLTMSGTPKALFLVGRVIHTGEMSDFITLLRSHPGFPSRLRDLKKWPDTLYIQGKLRPGLASVAIVGSRAASGQGMERAFSLAADLCHAGYSVVSGGALGVDAAAHHGAMSSSSMSSSGGHTVAVMACGLDAYYPKRNQGLFEAILNAGGAMLSPFDEGVRPLRSHFVRRNQIIAALADVVVVVEASVRSGSLHTAGFAASLGRPLGAMPGSPGCHALLAQGVPEIRDAGDVLNLLDGKVRKPDLDIPKAGTPEHKLWQSLSATKALSREALAEQSGLDLRIVQRTLLRMEIRSLVLIKKGGGYIRSGSASLAQAPGNSS